MPQEVIYPAHPGTAVWQARIGWQRDGGEVQLAVETFDDRALVDSLLDEDDRARFGAAARANMSVLDDTASDLEVGDALVKLLGQLAPYVAVWATMDRAGANRLIRMTRHARDVAFGRDE